MIFVQASSLCFLGGIQRENSTFISKYRNSDKMPHCCCHKYGSIPKETTESRLDSNTKYSQCFKQKQNCRFWW